jgi:hypothetical protein
MMPTLSAIAENSNALMMILREKRELRRELVAFFSGLETIWKGLPAELDQTSKMVLMNHIIDKGRSEISHGLEILDKQIDSLLEGYGASLQAMKVQLDDAGKMSRTLLREKDHIIDDLKLTIVDLESATKNQYENLIKCCCFPD